MDRIIFGDNQFFGINHMSEEKARAQAMKFRDAAAILKVVDDAYDAGIRSFMFTTHDLVGELCDHFRAHPERYRDLKLLPGMPYAHKYANSVAEKGVVDAMLEVISGNALGMLATGGMALLRQDPRGLMKILVDAEMKMFKGLRTPVVFLQNIVTDLLLGLGEKELFAAFADHIRNRYDAEPGFVTMDLPRLVDVLLDAGVQNPVVCSSVNPIGYLMNPSREACEETIRTQPFQPVAMSVFASGAVAPQKAIEYIAGQPQIRAVLFGASSRAHIEQTCEMIRRTLGTAA